ncbi:uncharacterized protein KQ657_000675 [Scheffersomyces spartinae]|uniref:Exocyst complex component SEC5 n=1 Tax=Scheffersomyces spartinae TaxID=45513 RepID=A0A9P8AIF2_9ASCO|nr:uncharacterized protein KQ657_000675 [Scheffersomyces spartinae]KAG7193604.1 hypothetical protein KQ657_000675 [Scheffersomyces spartinae]
MLDFNPAEDVLLANYGLSTTTPRSLGDLKPAVFEPSTSEANKETPDIDSIVESMTTEQKYSLLGKLMGQTELKLGSKKLAATAAGTNDDPLGIYNAQQVMDELITKGELLSIEDNANWEKFSIGSQTFNSQLYLSQVHSDTTLQELVRGMDYILDTLEAQSVQLKLVVDSNYLDFINIKTALDDVLIKFKTQKNLIDRENSTVFNPNKTRGLRRLNNSNNNKSTESNKNLVSDLEITLQGLSSSFALLMRPIFDHRGKEMKIAQTIEYVIKYKFFFDMPQQLTSYLQSNKHDLLIETYNSYLTQRKVLKIEAQSSPSLKKFVNTALLKVFDVIEGLIREYRENIYKELLAMDSAKSAKFSGLVDKLLQFPGSDNPIIKFLDSQLDQLAKELDYQVAKFDRSFISMQSKLKGYARSLDMTRTNESFVKFVLDKYRTIEDELRTSSYSAQHDHGPVIIEVFEANENVDFSIINETWLILTKFIESLQVIFSDSLGIFASNYSTYYHYDNDGKVWTKFLTLVESMVAFLIDLFNDANNSESNTAAIVEASPQIYTRFIPHYSNSISSISYLTVVNRCVGKLLTVMGGHVVKLGNLIQYPETNNVVKHLRSASTKVSQKITEAICSTWVNDCSQFYELEKWEIVDTKSNHHGTAAASYTKLVQVIEYYQTYVLSKLASLVFDNLGESPVRIVASYPSKRTLVSIEIQFMRSLNILVESIMKKYNVEMHRDQREDLELFKILSMNNFDELQRQVYPRIIRKFDTLFDKQLSDQQLKLFDDIDKVSQTIFHDILLKEKSWINREVIRFFAKLEKGDMSMTSSTQFRADGLIYEILIHFVRITHSVKPLTNGEVFQEIITELQELFLRDFMNELRSFTPKEGWPTKFKLDINFFVEIFELSITLKLNERCLDIVNSILRHIDLFGEVMITEALFNDALNANLRDSAMEFDCFL